MEKRNPVGWFEIAANDLERAKKFYTSVFGLQVQYMEMADSKMYMFGGGPESAGSAGSLIQSPMSKPNSEGTIVYFSCADLTKELSIVEGAGGKVVLPKTSIGEFGFIALISDSEGNTVGLHTPASM